MAKELSVRVGVSHGEVTSEEGDWFGTPVVEAAQLEAVAASGTVLAAEVVRTTVGSRGGFHFDERRLLHLKGLPGPLQASRVRKSDSSPISTKGPHQRGWFPRRFELVRILRVQSRRHGVRVTAVLALVILIGTLATLTFNDGAPTRIRRQPASRKPLSATHRGMSRSPVLRHRRCGCDLWKPYRPPGPVRPKGPPCSPACCPCSGGDTGPVVRSGALPGRRDFGGGNGNHHDGSAVFQRHRADPSRFRRLYAGINLSGRGHGPSGSS